MLAAMHAKLMLLLQPSYISGLVVVEIIEDMGQHVSSAAMASRGEPHASSAALLHLPADFEVSTTSDDQDYTSNRQAICMQPAACAHSISAPNSFPVTASDLTVINLRRGAVLWDIPDLRLGPFAETQY